MDVCRVVQAGVTRLHLFSDVDLLVARLASTWLEMRAAVDTRTNHHGFDVVTLVFHAALAKHDLAVPPSSRSAQTYDDLPVEWFVGVMLAMLKVAGTARHPCHVVTVVM